MDLGLAFNGLLFGFSIAASVGPIWLLCMRRTLSSGPWIGLASGLGVATADGLYAALAAFGLSLVTSLLIGLNAWLRLAGGIVLLYLGYRTVTAGLPSIGASVSARGLTGAYVSTLALTLTNPLTIVAFLGIFAGLGLGGTARSTANAVTLVGAVFLGSATWWVVLAVGVSLIKERLSSRLLRGLNLGSGLVIGAFGIVALASGPASTLGE